MNALINGSQWAMDKLIAILYLIYAALFIGGCATKADYEIRLWLDRGADEVNGYIMVDGVKHTIKGEYDE